MTEKTDDGMQVGVGNIQNADDLWINTWLGVQFHPFRPTIEEISTLDIVHATSNMSRFTGHCDTFYSVAEHQGLVANIIHYWGGTEDEVRAGSVHDAPEAYIIDLARPIKIHPDMVMYRRLDNNVSDVVMDFFGVPRKMPDIVKKADMLALAIEAEVLIPRKPMNWQVPEVTPELRQRFPIQALPPREAKTQYLALLATLFPLSTLKLPEYAPVPAYKFAGSIQDACPVPVNFGKHSPLAIEGNDVVCRSCKARDVDAMLRAKVTKGEHG